MKILIGSQVSDRCPLGFLLIYVNDMSGAVNHKLLLYADNSNILVAEVVSEWLVDNELSLHLGKTESILFGSKSTLQSQLKLGISCKGTHIESKEVVKYLGAVLEQCLSGESMVKLIIQKANARLKFLFRKLKFLDLHSKQLLVMSLIQCHFDYAYMYEFILVPRFVAIPTE